jgi:succinate dehydrogenase / fumarate reductase flavoprotein subunit
MIKDIKEISSGDVCENDAKTAIDEFENIRNSSGKHKVPVLRDQLQQSMTDNAGVFRTEKSLLKQLNIIKEIKQKFKDIAIDDNSTTYNTDLQEAVEFGHMIDYSTFIVKGAIERKESRGAHFRDEYPQRDDINFLKHTMGYMDKNGDINIEYMDVVLGRHELAQRTY